MARTSSFFVKLIAVVLVSLGGAASLSAQATCASGPCLSVSIQGELTPLIGGSGGVTSGTYVSGITSATGTSSESCTLTIVGPGGSGATATVLLGGTNTPPTTGTILNIQTPGKGYGINPFPTAATITGGTAACTGSSIAVATKVDDPLNLTNAAFQATTLIPVDVTYNPTSESWQNLPITFCTPNCTTPTISLPCTATGQFNVTSGAPDTFKVSNCTFSELGGLIKAAFQATVSFPPGTLPAPLPVPFSAAIDDSPLGTSEGTYTMLTGTFAGVATVLGLQGTITAVCPSTGTNACATAEVSGTTLVGNTLSFSAQAGGSAPAAQTITVSATPAETAAFAVTSAVTTTTGSVNWLTANVGGSAEGGQLPGNISVSVNPAGLAASATPYTGTVTVLTSTSNSPLTVNVSFLVSPASFSLLTQPSSFTFTCVSSTATLCSTPAAGSLSVTTSTNSAVTVTATASSTGNWLSVNPATGTTPATIAVKASPSGVPAGINMGSIALSAAGSTNSPTVAVTFNVTDITTPSPLSFSGAVGTTPSPQPLNVTATGPNVNYTVTASSTPAGWLIAPVGAFTTNGTAPMISVNTGGLIAGKYSGTITINPAGGGPIQVGVTLTLNALPTLNVSSSSLTFNMMNTGTLPAQQPINVSASDGSSIPFSVAVGPSGNNWLSAAPSSGTTPATVSVSILQNLAPGTYSGTLTFSSASASTPYPVVTVTFVVNNLALSASSLAFSYQLGSGQNPAAQLLGVASSLNPVVNVAFTAAASVTTPNGGTWLSVTPTSQTTPFSLSITATPGVLTAGNYSGMITVSSGGANFSVPVTFVVSALPSLAGTPPPTLPVSFSYTIGSPTVPNPVGVSITSSSGSATITGVSATTSTPWLSLSPSSGASTPFTLSVGLIQAMLPTTPGPYSGSFSVSSAGASNTLTYTVNLTVAAQPTLSVTPTSTLTFNGTAGSSTQPLAQNLTVSAANGTIAFTAVASVSTPPSGTWLSVTPTSGSTSSSTTVAVSVNNAGLAPGNYSGMVTVTSTTSGTTGGPFVIPVSFVVAANSLTAAPTSLSFTYSLGGTAPAAQTLNIGSIAPGLTFTAAAPGASWLSINPTGGTTTASPVALSVSILTAGLTAQTYHTSIAITAAGAGNSPLMVPVTLTVNVEPSLAVAPTSLSFSYLTGGTAPAPQSVAVSTSNASSTPFSVSATSSGNWLQVSPTSGTAPGSFLASIVPGGLTAGTYIGTINVTATGYNSTSLTATLVVTQPKAVIQVTGTVAFTLANSSPPVNSTLAISASDGSAQAFTIAAGASQYNWLSISPTSGTTPANVTLTVNPAGLVPGVYTIPVTVTMPGLPIPTLTVQTQLTITGSNLVATPNALTFSYQHNGTFPPAQIVALTTASGTGTVPLASVTANVGWLSVSSAPSAPATLLVSISPGLLTPGTYLGAVLIRAVGSPTTSLEITVTLTVGATLQLTVNPAALTFNYQTGGAAPVGQSFAIASGNTPVAFTTSAPSWVTLSPSSGNTPASVLVTVNPAGLAVGTYGATITVTGTGTNSATVAVTLNVTSQAGLSVAPSQLTFTAPVGGPAPAPQTLTVTSGGAALSFTAAASSPWLSVTPATGTTPATLAVSVNVTGLAQGTYNGTINLSATTGPMIGSVTEIPVTLQVGAVSALTITGVINAASGAAGTVAPGMAVSIFGTALGPQTAVSFTLPAAGGTVATTLGGTEVMFDGVAVPILYTSSTQVNVLAPFELAGKASTVVTVSYNNLTSSGTTLTVVAGEPGLFTANASGKGEGAILNQDGTVNSASNPAAPGSVIQLFGTGAGLTAPASVDGGFNPIPPPLGALDLHTSATVGGESADVYYSGPAPGLLAGIFQVDVTLPADTASGNIPVAITLTCATPGSANCISASSQANVTVVVGQ